MVSWPESQTTDECQLMPSSDQRPEAASAADSCDSQLIIIVRSHLLAYRPDQEPEHQMHHHMATARTYCPDEETRQDRSLQLLLRSFHWASKPG